MQSLKIRSCLCWTKEEKPAQGFKEGHHMVREVDCFGGKVLDRSEKAEEPQPESQRK